MKYISKIKLQHAKCISFDLFDTLISRFCASPDYIFYRVGLELTQLGQINDPEEFKILRKKAEFELRQGLKFKQEVTISNIYSKLIQDYPKLDPQQGIEIELGIEEYFIYPIKSNWLFLEELVNQKKRVVITSDIYLPSNFIKKIVKKYITPQAFNALGFYISSELKLLKSTEKCSIT